MKRMTLAFLLFLCQIAASAPAPFPEPCRNLNERDVVGTWKYCWGESSFGLFHFHADGSFNNNLGSSTYAGTWKVSDNKITILERQVLANNLFGDEMEYIFQFSSVKSRRSVKVTTLKGNSYYKNSLNQVIQKFPVSLEK